MQSTQWLKLFPEQASSFAWQVDALFLYLVAVGTFFTIAIVAVLFYFVVRYREREKYATPQDIVGGLGLEITWTVIPFLIVMSMFVFGTMVFFNQYRIPRDAMEVFVVGKQWMWKFQHASGQREINELHVPVGRKVKLTMTTEDVIHDLYIPDFRTKADTVPGRYSNIWFEATKPGRYRLFCAEYCGLNHSGMGGWVTVMEQRDFDNWLNGNTVTQTPVEVGRALFEQRLGCASCHQGGDSGRGPSLNGVYNSPVKLADGQTVVADDTYIRNSILNPQGQIVAGYQPIMPTYKGQITEEQIVQIIAYIRMLGVQNNASSGGVVTGGGTMQDSSGGSKPVTQGMTTGNPNSPTGSSVNSVVQQNANR